MGDISHLTGKRLIVTTKGGDKLFTLGHHGMEMEITAKKLYDSGAQWFEPLADNYLPLAACDFNLVLSKNVRHFSWQDIAKFAEKLLPLYEYRTNGTGDWKNSAQGAGGVFLVEIKGKPYWHDAVGQIPYAVGTFCYYLKQHHNKEKAVREVLETAQKHSTGNIIPSWNPVISNQYDDYFVLRGAIWASLKYEAFLAKTTSFKEFAPLSQVRAVNAVSADLLGVPLTVENARKYGLKK